MTPTVSVLMTAFNREQYIAAAIESVLAQTFTDFELVIVDDRSTDRSVEIATRYTTDPRVRVVVNATNLGQFQNRNYAAGIARGQFLKYHDSDDIMYPHCLEVMMRGLAAEPTAAFALSGSRDWPGAPEPFLSTPRLSYLREYTGTGMFHLGPPCALFRREAFHALGGFPIAGVHSDLLFWLNACRKVNVVLVPGDLFWYRIHADQALQSGGGVEYARLARYRWQALDGPDCPLDGAELELARRNQAAGVVKHLIEDVSARNLRLAWFRVRNSGLTTVDWLRYARPPRRRYDAGSPALHDKNAQSLSGPAAAP